ncbi:MAG TPA: hypothetical protein ENN43_04515 [bacterium]|nr:hypothetical protein [bacterium]
MISFGRHICNDFNIAVEKEWLITNRKGSYASSTILNTNTRKYHGLLVAKMPGLDNRYVIFPNCDEEVDIAGKIHPLSTHKYRGTVYPRGYSLLENFSIRDDVVTFLYLIENVRIKKEILLMKNANTVMLNYSVLTPDSHVKIHIRPFIAFREPENLMKEITLFDPVVEKESEGKVKVSVYANLPAACIYAPEGGDIRIEGIWYRDFYYLREDQLGFQSSEDLYNIGVITMDVSYGMPRAIVLSTEDYGTLNVKKLRQDYKAQIKKQKNTCVEIGACVKDDDYRMNIRQLVAAADSFVVEDGRGRPAVMAGYLWPHYIWFRDTFASLPGLFLVLKKFDEAKNILLNALEYEKNGLLPISMTIEGNETEYASVDTTLWFFYAVYKYLEYTKDFEMVKDGSEFFERLRSIIEKHKRGTDFNIKIDDDGLIYAGMPGIQLTWMDSRVNGAPVTPRIGKQVEVNALWFNAVMTMKYICEKNGNETGAAEYGELAQKIKTSFGLEFWDESQGYLYDTVEGGNRDDSVRPNQVLALSLPFELIDEPAKKQKILNTIIKELYTSFGLRTLSNENPSYKARYEGDQAARNRAVHQGTVWGWTIGHFVTAYLRTYGRSREHLSFIETAYEPFFEHLKTAGLGTVSEMFDGSFPYTARGRISHGWAVAEILRSYFEDYMQSNGTE